jgi:putative endopeptidase
VLGSWVKNVKFSADRLCAGPDVDIGQRLITDLESIVERAAARHAPAGDISQQIGDLYASYMDEDTLNKRGIEPVRHLLEAVDGITNRDQLNDVLVLLNATASVADPFPVGIGIDPNDPNRYVANISQGGLSLGERDFYLDTDPHSVELRNQFVAHATKILDLAGYGDSRRTVEQMLALETKLATVQWSQDQTRDVDKTNNMMSRADVERLAAGAPLRQMFDALKLPAVVDFQVAMPDVLTKTAHLWATEPVEAWKSYLRFHVLDAYSGALSRPFSDENFEFGKRVSGAEERSPRWQRGVSLVSGDLGFAVGQEYVDAHFTQQTKDQALALVENLRKAYTARIDGSTWMGPETKKEALTKLSTMVSKIGYPDTWKSYSSVAIHPDDLIGNERNLQLWSWHDDLDKLSKPVDRTEWGMTPQTNNAYYSARFNEIVFPAGILQPPYFDPAADPAANYGAIGATIGHEMSHAFDDQGRKSDENGMQRDWWKPADAARYQEKTARLVAQFAAYEPVPGVHIDGVTTLGENIADLAGLRVAYDAYKLSLGGKEAPIVDGLTGDQRFFLAYAAGWKKTCRPETARNMLLTDDHSPEKYRVNGIVRNIDEWYAAFDVKPGDALYLKPEDRIKLW